MLRSCLLSDLLNSVQRFLSSFVEFRSAVSEEKSKMSQPIRSWGGHLVFLTGPKNTNLEKDTEILLPVKFCWIPLSRFRGEVKNVSADQRPRRPSCFSDRPEKHKLWRGDWDLASCQVLLNSVKQIQRRSRKCLSQSEARAAILFFWSTWKTQTWWGTLRSCFLSSFVEFRAAVSEEKSNTCMFQPIRGQGGHLVFSIGPKNANFVEDVAILLPVKFRWIPCSSFRGEVENVSANQRPGRPSCFFDRPKNTNLVEYFKILLPVKFCWILFSDFRGEVENVSVNQRPGRHLVFPICPKTQTW